jgi:hypothetical protein
MEIRMKPYGFVFFIVLFMIFLWGSMSRLTHVWSGEVVDYSLYAELLEKYVKNGVVNYRGFKDEDAKLDRYLKILEDTDSKTLSRNEQFAFYINAYNAWTIKLILSGYPGVESIKDLGTIFRSPWKKKICRIDGDVITLDDIEHGILRPRFQDPRIHFAVNCASKGCPPLRSEPYQGNLLDQQLDEMTDAFINDPTSNFLEAHTLYVNEIFKWFAEDFKPDVLSFFLKYAGGNLKERLRVGKQEIKIRYLDYDWSLNGK